MKATEPDFLVSLGDLGESKDCTESKQLYAGTTECFKLVRDYFDGFEVPFNIVGGNHDLEGIDEFNTDKENLEVFLDIMGKETPQFCHEVAPKTLLVGLGSTVFRDATYTSHEVFVDAEQVAWFDRTARSASQPALRCCDATVDRKSSRTSATLLWRPAASAAAPLSPI